MSQSMNSLLPNSDLNWRDGFPIFKREGTPWSPKTRDTKNPNEQTLPSCSLFTVHSSYSLPYYIFLLYCIFVKVKVLVWDPMDCSPSGCSVHGILQIWILELVAMPSFRGSSQPRGQTHFSYISCIVRQVLDHSCHLGSPNKPALLLRKNPWTLFWRCPPQPLTWL